MSDTPHGPGWWLASDGRWYPPTQVPGTPTAVPFEYRPTNPTTTSGLAAGAMMLGIVGLFVPFVCILALTCAYPARAMIRNPSRRLKGRAMAGTGIVLGWIGFVFTLLFLTGHALIELVKL